jgi:hypothetical protein
MIQGYEDVTHFSEFCFVSRDINLEWNEEQLEKNGRIISLK